MRIPATSKTRRLIVITHPAGAKVCCGGTLGLAAFFSALLSSVPSGSARAQPAPHAFEGVWIWDRAAYVPPPGMPAMTHMVEETMSVSRDDGTHFTGQIRQVYDNGGVTVMDEDFAEDGKDHPVPHADPAMTVRTIALSDGGRRVVSLASGEVHDSICHVSDGGRTLICNGTHKAQDGSTGDYVCVYHRDPHVIPIAAASPRGRRKVA